MVDEAEGLDALKPEPYVTEYQAALGRRQICDASAAEGHMLGAGSGVIAHRQGSRMGTGRARRECDPKRTRPLGGDRHRNRTAGPRTA